MARAKACSPPEAVGIPGPVSRPDRQLRNREWLDLRSVSGAAFRSGAGLVVCAGFEDRAIEVLERVRRTARCPARIALVRYEPENAENKIEEMRALCASIPAETVEVLYDRERPMGGGERIADALTECGHVFVDISGMSRLLIVQVLVALWRRQANDTSVLYCEAEHYLPSQHKWVSGRDSDTGGVRRYLSSGVVEVAVTPELSSVAMPGEAVRLIAFPSFDPSQLANVVHELQPTYTDVMHGIPPRAENAWRTDAVRHRNRRTLSGLQRDESHEVSTMDYRETLHVLMDIYARRSAFDRIVIAPIGSKMQSVAVALFRAVLRDVQIVYPIPQEFSSAAEYTTGVRALYQLDF